MASHGLKMRRTVDARGHIRHIEEGITDPRAGVRSDARYPYSLAFSDRVVQRYMEGYSLPAISRMEGMPTLAVLQNWMARRPEFAKRMREAKKCRWILEEERRLQVAGL